MKSLKNSDDLATSIAAINPVVTKSDGDTDDPPPSEAPEEDTPKRKNR